MPNIAVIEKLAAFNRERIPERVVHTKGAGAHGSFVATHDVSHYTKASVFQIGKETPVLVRFSSVGSQLSSPDAVMDNHGFAVKFYTEGNSLETFPIRDSEKFPDLHLSIKRNAHTNLVELNKWWEFISLNPETTFHTIQLFSDMGRPDGYRRIDGFGVHAFKLVNSKDEKVFAKFHWRTKQERKILTDEEVSRRLQLNPYFKTQDLFEAIAKGDFPSWNLYIQIMTVEQANQHPRNPFDVTRTWREEDYPLIPVGTMTLEKNPCDVFCEIEQAAFSPSNLVSGIEPGPDATLEARMFAYKDAQRYRLGRNFQELKVNRPITESLERKRDGPSGDGNNGGGGGDALETTAGIVPNYRIQNSQEDEHVEAGLFLDKDIDWAHRCRLVERIAHSLQQANQEIQERVLRTNFDPIPTSTNFGNEIREALKRAK